MGPMYFHPNFKKGDPDSILMLTQQEVTEIQNELNHFINVYDDDWYYADANEVLGEEDTFATAAALVIADEHEAEIAAQGDEQ